MREHGGESGDELAEENIEDSDSSSQGKMRWYCSLPYFVAGDVNGFAAVFSNNMATMLAGTQMLREILPEDIVYQKIIPGVGLSMAFGCLYYVIMAQVKAAKTGRTDLCALPFGINTPGMFAFNTGIIYAVYYKEGADAEAARMAWKVGVVSNFVQGLVEIALAPIGPRISAFVPMVALLGSLASVGMAFLFTGTIQTQFAWPQITIAPFFLLIAALFAGVSAPKIPATVPPIVLGAVLAWCFQKAKPEDVSKGFGKVCWSPVSLILEPFEAFAEVGHYIGIAIPVALTVAIGTIQVREMAKNAGDSYNLRLAMLGDGMATVVASLCGSPWGMTVFIGHSAFKSMGAKIGYSIFCAIGFVFVCFSGTAALLLAIFPAQVLNPIILFVGLSVVNEALDITPSRHWPAFIVSLIPGMCNWAMSQCSSIAAAICSRGFLQNGTAVIAPCAVEPTGDAIFGLSSDLQGLYSLGQGYLITSIVWGSLMIYVIDRRFHHAALWAFIAAIVASFGLIHSSLVFLPWEGPPQQSAAPMYWDFVIGYCLAGVAFLFVWALQTKGMAPGPDQLQSLDGASESMSSPYSLPPTL